MAASRAGFVGGLARSLLKSLLQSALIIGATLLLSRVDPKLGLSFGVVASAFLMLRTYHREWRLSWLTCLLPPLGSAACLLCQAMFLSEFGRPELLAVAPLPALFVGWLSGRGHAVFERQGQVWARRTSLYLFIWVASVAVTQLAALFDLRQLVGPGLVGGGFSLIMVATMSVVLLGRYRRLRRAMVPPRLAGGAATVVLLVTLLAGAGASPARAEIRPGIYRGGLDDAVLASANSILRRDYAEFDTRISATEARVQVNPDGSALLLNDVEFRMVETFNGYTTTSRFLFSPMGGQGGKCWRSLAVDGNYSDLSKPVDEGTVVVKESADGTVLLSLQNGGRPNVVGPIPWRIRYEGPLPGGTGRADRFRNPEGGTVQIDFSDPRVASAAAVILLFLLIAAAMNLAASRAHAEALYAQATRGGAPPSPPPPPPLATGEPPALPPQPGSADVEEATNLQNELNERRAWRDKLRRDIDGFRGSHQWESDYAERLRAMEADLADEAGNITELESRLGTLGVAADAAAVKTYEYGTRYSSGDRDNRLRALEEGEDAVRRQAGVQYGNLMRIFDRVQRDDTLDLQRLRDDGSELGTQLGHLMTEFFPSDSWSTAQQVGDRASFLRKLRSRLDDLGSVDDQGRFHGSGADPARDPATLEGRIGDIQPALEVMERLVRSQRGEAPVAYGSADAWADATAAVTNAMSLGTGAEVGEALERGGGVPEAGRAFGHGLLNVLTAGGLSGAEQGWEGYWSRGPHDGSVGDYLHALTDAVGTGVAHAAANTVLPVEAVGLLKEKIQSLLPVWAFGVNKKSDATAGQCIGALVQVLGGAVSTHQVGSGLAGALGEGAVLRSEPILPRDAVGANDLLRFMPENPVQRGTYLRNLLRDRKIREDLVRRVDYRTGPPPAGGKVKLGETFPGEPPTAVVYDAAFERGQTSVESTGLHEVDHLQQFDQRAVQAASSGPLAGTMRGGRPTATGSRQMELEVRMNELDRNLRTRNDALGRAGIDQNTVPPKGWPADAQAAQREVDGARRAITDLIDQDRRVREITPKIEGEHLSLESQRSRVQGLRGDIEGLRAQLELEPRGSAGTQQLADTLKSRQAELEVRQSAMDAAEARPATAGIEKGASVGVEFQRKVNAWAWDRGNADRQLVDLDEVARVCNESGETRFQGGYMPLVDVGITDRTGDLTGFASLAASDQPVAYYLKKFEDLVFQPFNETNGSVQKMLTFHGYEKRPGRFVEMAELWVPEAHQDAVRQAVKRLVEGNLDGGVGQVQSYADHLRAKGFTNDQIVQNLVNKVQGKRV